MSVVVSRRAPWIRALVVALACAYATGLAGQQPAPAAPQPTFRLDASFVRVDMYPTIDGRPVTDLTREDIEIREDGALQAVETFEYVALTTGTPTEQRRDPSSVAQMRAEAENPRARVFVIFLDTGHTEMSGSHRMQRSLVTMLDRMLAPDDLFAVMTQHMSPSDLAFARKTESVEGYLRRHWTWGERDLLMPRDPIEQRYMECYPNFERPSVPSALAQELIDRRRETFAVNALEDLSIYLRGVREERKAVIAVTSGWLLPRENRGLAGPGPQPGRLGTTPDGRLTADTNRANYGYSNADCERDRQTLAFTDIWQEYQDMMETANRGNVSIYPVDSRGLAATDTPIGFGSDRPVEEEFRRISKRVDSLWTLAENTDGIAIVNTNNIDSGLQRIVADMTSYYLVGYYSSNTKLDGRYRKISVKVKRPGVDVRARRGYKAVSADELAPPKTSTTSAGPEPAVKAALEALTPSRTSQVKTAVGFARAGAGAAGPVRMWAAVELDAASAKGDFAAGGDIAIVAAAADGSVLSQGRATLAPGTRTALVDLGTIAGAGADLVVRTRVKPKTDGATLSDTAAVRAPTGATALVWRRGPTTAMKFVPSADRRLSRADRIRVEVPSFDGTPPEAAALLDRTGAPIALEVTTGTRVDGGQTWSTGDLALAALAPGDYVMKLTVAGPDGPVDVYTGIRVTP